LTATTAHWTIDRCLQWQSPIAAGLREFDVGVAIGGIAELLYAVGRVVVKLLRTGVVGVDYNRIVTPDGCSKGVLRVHGQRHQHPPICVAFDNLCVGIYRSARCQKLFLNQHFRTLNVGFVGRACRQDPLGKHPQRQHARDGENRYAPPLHGNPPLSLALFNIRIASLYNAFWLSSMTLYRFFLFTPLSC